MVMPDELNKGVKAETLNAYALWLGLRRLESMGLRVELHRTKAGWWAIAGLMKGGGKPLAPEGFHKDPAGAIAAVMKMLKRREADAARN